MEGKTTDDICSESIKTDSFPKIHAYCQRVSTIAAQGIVEL